MTNGKKALVIDDSISVLVNVLKYGKGKFEIGGELLIYDNDSDMDKYRKLMEEEIVSNEINMGNVGADINLPLIERMLRDRKYEAILLDGKIGLHLIAIMKMSEAQSDGDVIARRIRSGCYGETNRNARLYLISDSYNMFTPELGVKDLIKPESKEDFETPKYKELIKLLS